MMIKNSFNKDSAASSAVLAMIWLSVGLFIVYPVACIFARSVLSGGDLTLGFYRDVLTKYGGSLRNSVIVGVSTALLCTALSVMTALSLASARGVMRTALTALLLITMVSPPFVSSLAYIQLYGRRGWITYRLFGMSWDPYNALGVILMQSVSFVPLNALFMHGILGRTDADCIRAARDLGASPAAALRDIVLPQLRPGILVSLLLTFVRSISDFGTPTIIGGRFSTMASDIYLQLIGYSDLGLASAMNMFLLLPSLAAFFIWRRLMRGIPSGAGPQSRLDLRLRSCGLTGLLAAAGGTLFFTVMLLQYVCVFASGFIKMSRGRRTFTLEHLEKLMRYDTSTLLRSVEYALIVALLGTLLAMLISWHTERRRVRWSGALDCAASLPYMLPGTCFGIGYLLAFSGPRLRLTGTAAIVIANMLFKQLPTTTRICSAMLSRIPPSLETACRDLGGGRFAVLRDIIFPLMRPMTCFIYNFSASMTTAGAILFLINPGKKVAVFKLFDAVYVGEYATASLMASLIILTVLIAEGIAMLAGHIFPYFISYGDGRAVNSDVS